MTLALTAAAALVVTRMGVELLVAAVAGLLMVSMVEVAAHQTEAMVAVAVLLMAAMVVVAAEADVVPVDASRCCLLDVQIF